ncbi:MAG: proton-conducting transporter membrane subunit [Alphaproteobacteria bacterium]|nr:hypothetical protein [Alphaproteobacteria bacterium]MDY4690050.1 proton-conducting transporter membrane subunit [Alphaproteobacteria bacterium]
MIENVLYLSPLWILGLGALVLCLCHVRETASGDSFRLAKIFAGLGFGAAVIFYNRSAYPELLQANSFTLLFLVLMFTAMCAALFLSRKWYSSLNVSGSLFCSGLLLAGFAGTILVMSQNLALTAVSIFILLTANYLLFIHADKRKEIYVSSRLYAASALFAGVVLAASAMYLYVQNGGLSYKALELYFENNTENTLAFAAATALILVFAFMLGLAPLHFWYTETTGQIVLPVFTYLTLVPTGVCWAAFIKLNTQVLSAMEPRLTLFCQGLAVLSLFVGAVGACSGKNIRKIFAYGTVYQQGIVFLVLQRLTSDALNTAFIYLTVYLLAMYGVCVCLFGLKNKGEYLFMLSDFEGVSFRRPYIAAMLSVFLFSLIGFPPFLGFLGLFAVFSDLVLHNNFYQLAILLAALLVLAYAYLQIIKTMYFENSSIAYDRADRGIYAAVLITAAIMIILLMQPHFLMQDFSGILEGALTWQ